MPTLADLPKFLQDARYESDALARIAAITPVDKNVNPAAAEELTCDPTPANILARVFYMARPMPRTTLESILTPAMCQLLLEEGLLTCDPPPTTNTIRATCALVPARGFWGLRDFDVWATGKPRPDDHVLGVGIASTLLADFTVRRSGERVLDIGTGQGFQAATAASHAASVVGTDINPRAIRLAALALRINNIPRVELRTGSFFEPVEHEKASFDLLVSNPPFVIAPPHNLSAIGGNWIGDSFVQNLISRAPEFLTEGGWATLIGNWHHPTMADWSPRPVSWITGCGVDAWIVKLKTDDPRTYAATWLRHWLHDTTATPDDAAMAAALSHLNEWLEYYKSIHVGAISMGVIYLRKRTPKPGDPPNWIRTDAFPLESAAGKTGPQAQRLFAGETLLRSLRQDADILDHRLAISPASELVQRLHPDSGTWKAPDAVIRQTEGFEFPIALGPLPAQILPQLDGTRPARQVIQTIAQSMHADPNAAYAQTVPFLLQMLRMTHLGVGA